MQKDHYKFINSVNLRSVKVTPGVKVGKLVYRDIIKSRSLFEKISNWFKYGTTKSHWTLELEPHVKRDTYSDLDKIIQLDTDQWFSIPGAEVSYNLGQPSTKTIVIDLDFSDMNDIKSPSEYYKELCKYNPDYHFEFKSDYVRTKSEMKFEFLDGAISTSYLSQLECDQVISELRSKTELISI